MPASSPCPLRTRVLTCLLVGAAAVTVAACSSSDEHPSSPPQAGASQPPPPAPKPPSPPPPPVGKDHVEGLVRSVSGNTIQLTQRDRSAATVDITPTTMITELSSGALTDVKPGDCVNVRPVPQGADGAVTAQSVEISPSVAHRCPPPPNPAGAVFGIVDSVADNAIKVNSVDPAGQTTHTTVTVTDTTTYTKHGVVDAQAIQNGKCMATQGSLAAGVLQATTIDLEPCPPMGRPHHHFHLPWLHHHHH
ncbi:DUF5666 domain-containing protein [Mycobacterium paraterrae]|uniref:DUF5666 domain-containing protein n=1 Tax=Mycobacterium paraterrae TaxID=577492 RepID=A0ABY3VDR6_9MYCO|nr:DUF5666 domain-containing protein [Mycobacterium paraterrae]UMB67586.1 DUF5666 domain-containing protein [Mycobacterium paraterrae]